MTKQPNKRPADNLAKELTRAVAVFLRASGFIRRGGRWVAAN